MAKTRAFQPHPIGTSLTSVDSDDLSEGIVERMTRLTGGRIDLKIMRTLLQIRESGVNLSFDDAIRIAAAIAPPEPPDPGMLEWMQRHTEKPHSCVYFIQHGEYVKIGVTRQGAHKRLAGMQLPPDAKLVATIAGAGQSVETELHRRFAESRVKGEWFKLTDPLAALIASHAV